MMESVFLHLLNMSITAGWLVLAVLLLRLVFRRAPKWIHCLLWVLVAVRLLCPVSIESVLSLIPSAETVPVDNFLYDVPAIHSGVPVVDAVVNPVISNSFAPQPMNSVNPMQVVSVIAAYVWALGMAAMVLYAVITTLRLRRRVREAAYVRDNIWQCDRISTPFILGIIRPRIYLPTLLGAEEAKSVIAHEQAHLARRDHWWKPLGFLLLTVYWFNPLLWLGYILLCRDIEAACDERVVQDMDADGRREYSRVLLACSAPRHLVTACPLAFGETGVKSRIKSVLNYKKPAFWLIITAIVATVVAAVCLLTNPKTSISDDLDAFLSEAIIQHNRGEHTGDAYPTEAHTVFGSRKAFGRTTVYGMVLYEEYYVDENGDLQVQSGSHCPTILTVGKDADGNYTLVDYWTPRDGADYARDIRNRFPARHQGKAFDTDGHYKGHHSATYQKARQHFEPWQTALSQAILISNRIESGVNIFAAESHRVYDAVESEGGVTVYALVYYHEYAMVGGSLTERSGSLVPAAITFLKNVDKYDLVEYWTPKDNWEESIREKFPAHLQDKALDYARYPVEELKAECLAKAYAYFGLDGIYTAPLTFSSMTWLGQDKLDALYANVPTNSVTQYLPVIPITNRSELDAFIAEYKKEMNFDRAEGDGLTPIHQMSFYDDAFFTEKVLLAVYYKNGSCSVQPKIGGVVYEPTALQVQVDVYEPEAGDTALGQWFMLCEVNRAAIPNVQNYTAVVRSHLPTDQYAAAFTNMVLEKDLPGYTEAWRTRLTDDAKTALRQLLADRQWKYTSIYSRTFAFIGAFDLDGSLYYVTVDYDAVYKDGKMFDLTDAEGRFFRDLYKNTVVANTFTGRVTQVTAKAMLMECYDKDKFTAVWVSLQNIPTANPKVGEEYVVTHDQWVMETYPPQVTALRIIPVSSTPTVGTTTTTTTIPTTTTTAAYVPNTKKTTELTEQQKGKIVADFAHYLWYEEEWRNYENLEQTKQICAFRAYYGTYNGYMVVKLGTGFGPAMITEHDMADGYYFSVDGGEYIYLYRDGEFIGLSGAYKSGLITSTDIKDIWYYAHGGKYPVKGPVYGMDITPNTAPPTTTTTTTTLPTSTIVNKIVSPVSVGSTPYEGVSGKSIPYKEVQDLGFQIVPESWVETGIVSSYQQLKTQTGGTARSLAPLLGKYNEAFFQDYALVVVSYNETIPIYSPDYDINYVSDLIVNGDTLSILLFLGGPKPPENVKDWPTEMYQNNLVLEVKKDDIKTIKRIVPLRMVDYPA